MKNKLKISDISKLFDVPISTLRYWEHEGLIKFEREKENMYRSATVRTIRNLCDITFYRKLSVPVKELKALFNKDYFQIEELLLRNKDDLYQKISEMKNTLESIDIKLEQISAVKKLKSTPAEFVLESLPAVRSFDLYEPLDLKDLVKLEKNLIVMIPYGEMEDYRYGVFVDDDYPKGNLVRKKDPIAKTYLKVLLQSSYDHIEQNNLQYYYSYLDNLGYKAGLTLGKVLVSSNDTHTQELLHNYYETWIEVEPK